MAGKRVKILYVETYTHVAGGQKGLLDLVHHLDRDRFEPVVVVQGPGDLQRGLASRGVRHIRHRLEPFRNRWLPFSYALGMFPLLPVLRRERPDVVHSNHPYVGRYSGRAARRLGIPAVVTLRTIYGREIYDRENRLKTLLAHRRIVSNSDASRERLEADFPQLRGRIETIKNGIDLDKFRPHPDPAAPRAKLRERFGWGPDAVVLCQVASMVPEKGNEELARAFLDLAREDARLHLLFVGGAFAGTDNTPKLRALAAGAGLADRVHFTDFVWEVVEFLQASDVVVLNSRTREGLPRSVIEAMACAKPVVGADVGGMRELVRDGRNGFLVAPRDTAMLTDRLRRLCADPGLRQAFGEASLALAREKHDLRKMIRAYEDIYLELAREGRSGAGGG